MAAKTVLITGNTYPHKAALYAMGGKWNDERQGWKVPADKAEEAFQLVDGGPATFRAVASGQDLGTFATEREAIDTLMAPGIAASPSGTTYEVEEKRIVIRFAGERKTVQLKLERDGRNLGIVRGGALMGVVERVAAPVERVKAAKLTVVETKPKGAATDRQIGMLTRMLTKLDSVELLDSFHGSGADYAEKIRQEIDAAGGMDALTSKQASDIISRVKFLIDDEM
ncbi:hypothetical protein [Azospirillum sp. sgz302134]